MMRMYKIKDVMMGGFLHGPPNSGGAYEKESAAQTRLESYIKLFKGSGANEEELRKRFVIQAFDLVEVDE